MRWSLATFLLLAACAPAAQSPLQAPAQLPARVEPNASGYDIVLNRSEQPLGQTFAAPPDRVWPLALAAYTVAGLRIDGSDAVRYQVQTRGQVLRRQLHGESLSAYFDCGTEISGSIADTWRLKVDALMAVGPASTRDSSHVATMLTISASPVEGTSSQVTQCSSKGRLEMEIAQTIRQALARQPTR